MNDPHPDRADVPFDPELADVLPGIQAWFPLFLSLDALSKDRAALMRRFDPSAVSQRVETRTVIRECFMIPGPTAAPEVELVMIRSARDSARTAVLYYIHGGGMVTGTAHDIPEEQRSP